MFAYKYFYFIKLLIKTI